MTQWKFKTRNFVISYRTLKEPFEGQHMEPSLVEECEAKLKSKEWMCFTAAIEVRHIPTGEALATEYLGQCIYADPKDFIDHRGARGRWGSYFRQMVEEACKGARRELARRRKNINDYVEELNQGAVKC